MRIDAYNSQIQISTNNYINKTKETNKKASFSDNVSISKEGDVLASALKAVKAVPDIRKEKVDEIKERIQNGTYNVSSEDFANKILRNL